MAHPASRIHLAAIVLVLAGSVALPAAAAENTDVARISAVSSGAVVLQRGDDKTQLATTVNTPVLPGDFLATQAGTRAEVQLDGFTMLRLGEDVQARIVNNDATLRQVQVAQGTVILGIVHPESGAVEIDTPSATLRASEIGDYRVTVATDGPTTLTARAGKAEIVTPQQTYELLPGKSLSVGGAAENPTVSSLPEVASDALDAFSASRDHTIDAALNTDTYVPSSIAGYDDLNAYGRWVDVQPYGMVWNPYTSAGWAPYRFGSWVWADGFGWTWIASEPWGWTPFHYGRWFSCAGYGWCWYPPGLALVPIWYPALVGFFGFGDYGGITTGFQYWGWVPLAPYEAFYPWYPGWGGWHSHPNPPPPPPPPPKPPPPKPHPPKPHPPSPPRQLPPIHMRPDYGAKVVTSYRNVRDGATGVEGSAFRAGNFAKRVAIDPIRLQNITAIRGTLPMTPTAANLRFTQAPAKHVNLSPAFAQPRFARAADLPNRTPFNSQQQELNQTLRAESHAAVPAKPQKPPASDAWRRFESTRGHVTIPSVPQPRQYPITTPIQAPSHPVYPRPISAPISRPGTPPISRPISPPISRPISQPRPPGGPSSSPPSRQRPPTVADWQTFSGSP